MGLYDNDGLPEGWAAVSLLEISELLRGVSYAKGEAEKELREGLIPLLRANNISEGLVFSDLQYVPERRVSPDQMLKQGDVIVAMSSGSKAVVGKAATVLEPWNGTFGAFCGVLRPLLSLDFRFFGMFFQTKDYRKAISEASAGTNINNLKREYFGDLHIPLPPGKASRSRHTASGEADTSNPGESLPRRVSADRGRAGRCRGPRLRTRIRPAGAHPSRTKWLVYTYQKNSPAPKDITSPARTAVHSSPGPARTKKAVG